VLATFMKTGKMSQQEKDDDSESTDRE